MSGGATPLRAVRVEPELWEAARTKAAQQGDNLSAIIRDALRQYLEESANMQIRDEAVEAAFRAMYGPGPSNPANDGDAHLLKELRKGLEAAAPYMLVQAGREVQRLRAELELVYSTQPSNPHGSQA